MIMPLLPNDVVDLIIEEFYDDDFALTNTKELQGLALVARAWVRASQRGIFRSILLTSSVHHAQRLRRLITLFDANPRLAAYVKRLRLTEVYESSEECVVGVVNCLSEIDEISFSTFNWNAISPVLQEKLLRFLRCYSLTKVTFWDFDIARFEDCASLLCNVLRLKSLEIGAIRCNDWSMPGLDENLSSTRSLPPPRSIQPIDLDLRDTVHGQFLAWFRQDSCPFDIQNLRVLRLGNDGTLSYFKRAASMIRCAGKSLRELEIEGPEPNWQYKDAIHLGYARNLHHLTLLKVHQNAETTPVPWIESLFEPVITLNQHHPLQSLTIYLFVEQHAPHHDWDHWTAVDKIFENKAFAALEKVSIMFGYTHFILNASKEEKGKIRESLYSVLPFLAHSGKLRYNFCV